MELFLDLPRSEVRRRLDSFRLSDLQYFLSRKRLSLPADKQKVLDHIILKPGLVSDLMGVLYLREGITKKELTHLAVKAGVVAKKSDSREAIALRVWLRVPGELERAHIIAKAGNVKKWRVYLKSGKARFERKPLNKLKNAFSSRLRQAFSRDAVLAGLVEDQDRILALVRHSGRGVFSDGTRRIRYSLSSSEILLFWDWKSLKVNSVSEGSLLVVEAFSRALGYPDGFIPEDASAEVTKLLAQAQHTGKFLGGQIVRLKASNLSLHGITSFDVRGANLEKLLKALPDFPLEKIEVVEWKTSGKRKGFDYKSGRRIS